MMVSTLTSKERVVSHTTINTFTSSLLNLHAKLKDKLGEEDVVMFMEVMRPLSSLPVEYAGELGPLQRAVMQLLADVCREKWDPREGEGRGEGRGGEGRGEGRTSWERRL
jgi:hypothetical protein